MIQGRISTASDTPTKSRVDIPPGLFGSSLDKYIEEDHTLVWMTVSDVLENADKYRHSGCTEAHWISVVVSPLLHLVRRLKRHQEKAETKLEVLDMLVLQSTLTPHRLSANLESVQDNGRSKASFPLPYLPRVLLP